MVVDTAPSRRVRRRRDTLREIKEVARRLLVESGVQAVTLRGIAGEMGMSAPALYRYFASHEALVRELVADLYDELTATLEQARDQLQASSTGDQLIAVCHAFRGWSTGHPQEFGLVFANPVTGERHDDLSDLVEAAGQRFGAVFVTLFATLWAQDGFPVPDPEVVAGRFTTRPGPVADPLPPGPSYVFLCCWARLYGAIAMEVFGQLAWAVDDLDPLFDDLMADLAVTLALAGPDHRGSRGI